MERKKIRSQHKYAHAMSLNDIMFKSTKLFLIRLDIEIVYRRLKEQTGPALDNPS